jgi:hypothetical protein
MWPATQWDRQTSVNLPVTNVSRCVYNNSKALGLQHLQTVAFSRRESFKCDRSVSNKTAAFINCICYFLQSISVTSLGLKRQYSTGRIFGSCVMTRHRASTAERPLRAASYAAACRQLCRYVLTALSLRAASYAATCRQLFRCKSCVLHLLLSVRCRKRFRLLPSTYHSAKTARFATRSISWDSTIRLDRIQTCANLHETQLFSAIAPLFQMC